MEKLMTGFKWRWIIPIIGLFSIKQWSEWVFSTTDVHIKTTRNNIIMFIFVSIQVISYFAIIIYFLHLY